MHGLFTLLFFLLMFVFVIDPTVALCLMAVMISLLSPLEIPSHPSISFFFCILFFSPLFSLTFLLSHLTLFLPEIFPHEQKNEGVIVQTCPKKNRTRILKEMKMNKRRKGEEGEQGRSSPIPRRLSLLQLHCHAYFVPF
ncbi:hypothetical protein BKA57DRAFT_100171 [Linnemannia elongata]|nr:hypothetical protein BKA57DRAFT_100171 [Linnemannia elongata]